MNRIGSKTTLTPEASSLLAGIQALEPRIRAAADTIEAERCLPADLVEALRDTGLFRVSWPRSMGGLELDPVSQLEILEELSRIDGAVGWIGTFAALTGMTAARLDPAAARELFASPNVSAAGQYAPMGRAERVGGGYRVTGRWAFGSGCRNSDVITAGCVVTENGEPRRLADGQPETRTMLFPKASCTIMLDSWQVTGMRGTGSHDYAVSDLFVPAAHSFGYSDAPRHMGPLYALPAMFLFSHAPMPLGIARAVIDHLVDLSMTKRILPGSKFLKDQGDAQEAIARAEAMLGSARSWAYDVLRDVWGTLCKGEAPSPRQRAMFRLSLVHATRVAKDVVSLMYDAAGSSAIQQSSPLDRLMRDILTVCQHRVVQPKMYRMSGAALLGLGVNDPFF